MGTAGNYLWFVSQYLNKTGPVSPLAYRNLPPHHVSEKVVIIDNFLQSKTA